METINKLAIKAIKILCTHINHLGFAPVIHFELEGTYCGYELDKYAHQLNFDAANMALAALGIQGELKPEFWPCQWEWASHFAGQSPLKAAQDLAATLKHITPILRSNGAKTVDIVPVKWNAIDGRMNPKSRAIFEPNTKAVHIPNSIQINISALNCKGENAIPYNGLGEKLQASLIQTSQAACVLYAPEAQAFERLRLKTKHGLSQELSSPYDISGGHQGSIALYKDLGKHNQKMGESAILVDSTGQTLVAHYDWHPLSRVEFRLGSSSIYYNPYANTAYALANLVSVLSDETPLKTKPHDTPCLPQSLRDEGETLGAISLFRQDDWLNQTINNSVNYVHKNSIQCSSLVTPPTLGDDLKAAIVDYYVNRPH